MVTVMATHPNRAARLLGLIGLACMLSACIDPTVSVRRTVSAAARVERSSAASVKADQHRVEKGDTLYGIAFRYQLDVREIVQLNQIYEPYIIYPGQVLRLKSEASSAQSPGIASAPAVLPDVQSTSSTDGYSSSAVTTAAVAAPVAGTATVSDSTSITLAPTVVPTSEGFVSVSPNASAATSAAAQSAIAVSNPVASSAAVSAMPASDVTAAAPAISAPTLPAIPEAMPIGPLQGATGAPKPGSNGWAWPTDGRLLSTFAASDAGRQGIDIRGNLGQPVYAAKAGTVVYSGRGIRGYGELIVIKHDENTLSAYGHNQTRSAKEGQVVKQGALIAEMGKDPQGKELLHFEVRKNGKPVDPLGVLPRR